MDGDTRAGEGRATIRPSGGEEGGGWQSEPEGLGAGRRGLSQRQRPGDAAVTPTGRTQSWIRHHERVSDATARFGRAGHGTGVATAGATESFSVGESGTTSSAWWGGVQSSRRGRAKGRGRGGGGAAESDASSSGWGGIGGAPWRRFVSPDNRHEMAGPGSESAALHDVDAEMTAQEINRAHATAAEATPDHTSQHPGLELEE